MQNIQDIQLSDDKPTEKTPKEFVDGLIVKKPRETAPKWIKCNLSIKRADMIQWLEQKDSEWINVQLCEARSGKWYAEVDNWQPSKDASSGKGYKEF